MAVMRVAHVIGKMVGGGVESVVMNYYRHIDRSRIQFDFLIDSDSTIVPYDEIVSLGGRVITIPPYQNQVKYQEALIKLFRRERWPIVQSHINALSVFPLRAAKRAGVPVRIAHSHSTSGRGEFKKNVIKAVLKRFANVYPTHRMACSRFAGEWLFGVGTDFDVLYNAIELDRFAFNPDVRAQVRSDLGLAGDVLAVGHVGRFTEQKNHAFLVEAFAELTTLRPDSVLLLAGTGEKQPLVESWVLERGIANRVKFLGQRTDVDKLYQAFDVFALPSLYEGLGIVGIEAQEAGLPCILSDQITRELDVTGTARFLSIEDPKAWARELAKINARSVRSVNTRLFQNYDIESVACRLADRYSSFVGEMRSVR